MKRKTHEASITPAELPLVIQRGVPYTPVETAGFLKVEEDTLAVWRATGRYPGLKWKKAFGRIRYMGQDILAFLNGPHTPAAPYIPKAPRGPKLVRTTKRRRAAKS